MGAEKVRYRPRGRSAENRQVKSEGEGRQKALKEGEWNSRKKQKIKREKRKEAFSAAGQVSQFRYACD